MDAAARKNMALRASAFSIQSGFYSSIENVLDNPVEILNNQYVMKGYGQFCPVAKASEVFSERWTPLVIRELMCGSHRFSELRKGNPLMSPTILSQRLKSLEDAGVVEKRKSKKTDGEGYHLTRAGKELGQVVVSLGIWGDKWARSQLKDDDYDPSLLMWDVRRRMVPDAFPPGRTVIHFQFLDMPSKKRAWWLKVEEGDVDLCLKDPGFEIDLVFRTTAKVMVEIWNGYTTVDAQLRNKSLTISGSRNLKNSINHWLGFSVFKDPQKLIEATSVS
jgi:DNA-binding HxlR family transcriptional regulator